MTNGAHSGLFLSCAQCYGGLGTDNLNLWPEYSAPVGHPSAEPAKDNRTGVWSRNYSKALCLVNPANSSRRVPLPADHSYMTLYGEPVPGSAVTLDAASGLVLLRHNHVRRSKFDDNASRWADTTRQQAFFSRFARGQEAADGPWGERGFSDAFCKCVYLAWVFASLNEAAS